MNLEWEEDTFIGFPTHQASTGMLTMSVSEFPDGEYWWLAVACNSTPAEPSPRKVHYETVAGVAATLDDAKVAAETMGRRMRKVLRWAR